MYNYFILLGIITNIVVNVGVDDEEAIVTLKVRRQFQNQFGDFDVDLFNVYVYGHMAGAIDAFVKKGQLVGMVGHIENDNGNNKLVWDRFAGIEADKEEYKNQEEEND